MDERVEPGHPPPPLSNRYNRTKERRKKYLSLILGGLVIIFLGGVVMDLDAFMEEPDYEGDQDTSEEYERYLDRARTINALGLLMRDLGLIPFGVGLVIGAFEDRELAPVIRLGLLLAAAFVVGIRVSGTISFVYI